MTRIGTRRLGALLVVTVLATAAVVLDETRDEKSPRAVTVRTASGGQGDGPVIPETDALSVAWYCAEGTSTRDGRADETIIIANLSPRQITATITVMPGGNTPPATRVLRVDARAQRRQVVSEILATPDPGVVVEIVGGPAVVEHEVRGRNDVAIGPCAREPSMQWYFAAGDTALGTEQWLALFNPFGDDAIVNITFLTDGGARQPDGAQGVVVPRRSRVSLAVHDLLVRRDAIAISVQVERGRIVAERSLRYDGSNGRVGLATSLGATSTSEQVYVPTVGAQTGVSQSLTIANFDLTTTKAEVRVRLDGDAQLAPRTVEVPARSVVVVDTSTSVPNATGYAISVRVMRGPPVVAELLTVQTGANTEAPAGVATTLGSTVGARRWVFPVTRLAGSTSDGTLGVLNVSDRKLSVRLQLWANGRATTPTPSELEVEPGERVVFDLGTSGVQLDQYAVVTAAGPIILGRELQGAGVTQSPGIGSPSIGAPGIGSPGIGSSGNR